MNIEEGEEADEDGAVGVAAKRTVSGKNYEVYAGASLGFRMDPNGVGAAGGGWLPHTFLFIDNKYSHIGTSYDVINGGLEISEDNLANVKERAVKGLFLPHIADFTLVQFIEWQAQAWIVSTIPDIFKAVDPSGIITAGIGRFPTSASLLELFSSKSVSCVKWTVVEAAAAIAIDQLGS